MTYREAARRNIAVSLVKVTVSGEFGPEDEPATGITYTVSVQSDNASQQEIQDLISHIDQMAEIHSPLRQGVRGSLKSQERPFE